MMAPIVQPAAYHWQGFTCIDAIYTAQDNYLCPGCARSVVLQWCVANRLPIDARTPEDMYTPLASADDAQCVICQRSIGQ